MPRTLNAGRRAVWSVVVHALAVALVSLSADPASAQYARPEGVRGLPREHAYQRTLVEWWATLTDKDFEVDNPEKWNIKPATDKDELLRLWILSLDTPRVGNKRSAPSTFTPANNFVLSFVESPKDNTVIRPNAWAEPITWLANFDHPSNPYRDSRSLKLRAFVIAAEDIMLFDEQYDHSSFPMWSRTDWMGPRLCFWAYVYRGTKDVLPEPTRKAYEEALRKMIARPIKWGPKGEETFFDVSVVTGMVMAAKAINDPDLTKSVEDYAKLIFAPGRFYNPAGYFADQGCFDLGFNGFSLYFATWTAAEVDWPWLKAAVAQAWKLRGHLQLPEPDHKPHATYGSIRSLLSPTHTTLRTGSNIFDDQWPWGYKYATAGFVSDDALCQTRWPSDDVLKTATEAAYGGVGFDLGETRKIMHNKGQYGSRAWMYTLWPEHQNFPMQNYGYDCYPKGFYKHLSDVCEKNPALLELPFDRTAAFTERFGDAYLIAKTQGSFAKPSPGAFGVIVHTGPIGVYPGNELLEYANAPYGLSGGTLSAFWTPTTGSVILGRRGGMFAPGGQPKIYDDPAQWRNWPVHAVIGTTDGESFFTSARITQPDAKFEITGTNATVKASGTIPASPLHKGPAALKGKVDFARTFAYDAKGLRVETTVTSDGTDTVAELYEAIPVFHRDENTQGKTIGTQIEFKAGDKWTIVQALPTPPPPPVKGAPAPAAQPQPAPTFVDAVSAVRLTRFNGAVTITFDKPRRVKLSPADAVGGFLTGHICRNLLVDLLDNKDQPTAIKSERTIAYTIAPEK